VDLLGEVLGGFSQSLTRWPLDFRDRHDHQIKQPDLHHDQGRHPDLERVAAVITEAWRQGSPVVGGDDESQRDMAAVAIRRWGSFERRVTNKCAHMDDRVEDLAKGLRDSYEPERALVGPLMEDYPWLAGRIAAALTSG
jgi:hypothetical protein